MINIRPAALSDAPTIRACAEEAYTPYIDIIGRKPAPMVADFRAQIATGAIHVATGGKGPVLGFIVFFPKTDHMFLENVAVFKSAGGQGIGKALIAYCETQTRELRLGSVRLYTNEKMAANLEMYPRLGYIETGRREEDGFNRVYFEKILA